MFPLNQPTPEQRYNQGVAALSRGELEAARELFEGVLKEVPNEPATLFHLGLARMRLGQGRKALAAFEKAAALVPANPAFQAATVRLMALLGMGRQARRQVQRARAAGLAPALLAELEALAGAPETPASPEPEINAAEVAAIGDSIARGEGDAAVVRAGALAALHPGSAFARNLLGAALMQAGCTDEAATAFEAAINCDQFFAEAYENLARLCLAGGNPTGALEVTRAALRTMPGHRGMRRLHIEALETAGHLEAAREAALALAADQPEDAPARRLAGRILMAANDPQGALEHLQAVHPRESDDDFALAEALAAVGRLDEAQAVLAAHAEGDQAVRAAHIIARGLGEAGDFEGARGLYRQLLAAGHREGGIYEAYGRLGRWQKGDPLIDEIAAAFADETRAALDRAAAGFALAKALEDTGEDDRLIAVLDTANALVRGTFSFDPATLDAEVDRLLERFDDAALAHLHRLGGVDDATPVFIVGLPRCGSTLVEQIIARHPQAAAAGELGSYVAPAFSLITGEGGKFIDPRSITARALRRLAAQVRTALRRIDPQALRITDKALNGFAYLPLIAAALPRATLIEVRRDPVDHCLSMYKNRFAEGAWPFTYDQAELARGFLAYRRLADAWAARLPGRVLRVDYDALVANPEPQARAIVEAVGLEWSDACLDPSAARGTVRTLSVWQARQKVHARSSHAWVKHAQGLGPLLEGLRAGGVLPQAAPNAETPADTAAP